MAMRTHINGEDQSPQEALDSIAKDLERQASMLLDGAEESRKEADGAIQCAAELRSKAEAYRQAAVLQVGMLNAAASRVVADKLGGGGGKPMPETERGTSEAPPLHDGEPFGKEWDRATLALKQIELAKLTAETFQKVTLFSSDEELRQNLLNIIFGAVDDFLGVQAPTACEKEQDARPELDPLHTKVNCAICGSRPQGHSRFVGEGHRFWLECSSKICANNVLPPHDSGEKAVEAWNRLNARQKEPAREPIVDWDGGGDVRG